MILYQAPNREDNYVGPRDFAYLAEVDILGWKFRKMKSGAFVIDTPMAGDVAGNLLMVLTPAHQALLSALIALEEPEGESTLPEGWENVGR